MKTYKIPVFWSVYADMQIEAKTLRDAIKKANELELPQGTYLEDSFAVDQELAAEMNEEKE